MTKGLIKIFKVIIYNCGIVLLLFIVLEISLRLFVPEIKLPGTQRNLIQDSLFYDSQGLKSNSQGLSAGTKKTVNSNNFWDYSKKNKAREKILLIGDSVTMGIGIENDSTFAGIINNSCGNIQILNPSLIGYSSHDYKNIIHKLIIDDRNSLGLKEIYICWTLNDIYSNSLIPNTLEFNSGTLWGNIVVFIRSKLYLYQFIKNIFTDRPKSYFLFDSKFYNSNNQLSRKALSDLYDIIGMCDKSKIKLKFVMFPYEYQLRNNSYSSNNGPQMYIQEILSDYNVQFYDAEKAFKNKIFNSKRYYLYGDGIHFSDLGHRLIAYYLKTTLNCI